MPSLRMAFTLLLLAFPLGGAVLGAAQQASWKVLRPTAMRSSGGATFTLGDDGSILVSGTNPQKDTHVLEVESELRGISGFRLEVLPHPSLRGKGPGRSDRGNFILNELIVQLVTAGPPGRRAIPLVNATATHSQNGWAVSGAVDGIESTGWAIHPREGTRQAAVFETLRDVGSAKRYRLVFRLRFLNGSQHSLGCYRLLATSDPRPLSAGEDPNAEEWYAFQEKINKAIDRGVEYLIDQQELDGSWSSNQPVQLNGMTALATYALIKSGLSPDHQAIRRAVCFMRNELPRKTYSISCQILALCALGGDVDDAWIQELADELMGWQKKDGGFAYPDSAVDLSNSQYAALALRAAAKKGIQIPPLTWHLLARRTLRHMEPAKGAYAPAGFGYHIGSDPTGSMTSAGVGILAICAEHLEESPLPESRSRVSRGEVAAAIRRGVDWLARHFSPSSNPPSGGRWLYYYLYGLERTGALLDIEKIGGNDWYREGARYIVPQQKGDGSWGNNQPDTAFALLFLTRATAPASGQVARGHRIYGDDDPGRDVSLRASGDTPLTVWISSFGEAAADELSWPAENEEGRAPDLHIAKVEYLLAGAELLSGRGSWHHSLKRPPRGWEQPGFNDRSWTPGPVLVEPVRRSSVAKSGKQRLLVRRSFELDEMPLVNPSLKLRLTSRRPVGAAPSGPPLVCLFDENPEFPTLIPYSEKGGLAELWLEDGFKGDLCLAVEPRQRHSPRIPGWSFPIARRPRAGEYRYLRFAWRKRGGEGIMIQLADHGVWGATTRRYLSGANTAKFEPAIQVARELPGEWTVVTRDLWRDMAPGAVLTGISFVSMGGGRALFDAIYLARDLSDFKDIPKGNEAPDAMREDNAPETPQVRVHLNGSRIFEGELHSMDFEPVLEGSDLLELLRPGRNVVALDIRRGELEQAVDLRLEDMSQLATVKADPSRPRGGERYARQITFPRPGEYRVLARVHVQPPPEEGRPGQVQLLDSNILEVRILEALDAEHLAYARAPRENILARVGAEVRASSQRDGNRAAEFAVDNLQGRAWVSRDDDPFPTLTITPREPVRANRLLLSHANQDRTEKDRTTRAHLVEVILNARGPRTVLEMHPSDQKKTVWVLPRATRVRRIHLRVISTLHAHHPPRGVGFGEVELQLVRRRR